MHPYCIYVFDSSTANEAAIAVKDGQYETIIQYHSNKHRHMADKQHPNQGPQLPSSTIHGGPPQAPPQPLHHPPQHVSPHMIGPPSSYPQPPPPHHHVSPSNHMQPQSQHPIAGVLPPPLSQPPQQQPQQQPPLPQPYDPNFDAQKMKDRESKLNRLAQMAQLTTQPPPQSLAPVPPTMHQMTNLNQAQQRSQPPPPPPQHQLQPPPPSQNQPQQQPPPSSQQQQQQQQQTLSQPSQQQQQPTHLKQEQQHLDPLSSMAAMSESPNLEGFGHTIHHHPPG